MRIAYVAKHGSGGNDDEGAIAHALTQLGCEVVCIPEAEGAKVIELLVDFVLFHKWHDLYTLRRVKRFKAFWYFDLVDYDDPKLKARCEQRKRWMDGVVPLVNVGFCTDGDWAARSEFYIRLPQGADGRIVGYGAGTYGPTKLLLTGIRNGGGAGRESFVDELRARYGNMLRHSVSGVYREKLRDLIAATSIVVAPDSPCTARYWSNRVYVACGFGAFVLHPFCRELQYVDGEELVYYHSREHLFKLIDAYLTLPEQRAAIADAGLQRTLKEHLYLHRCEKLLAEVKRRM